MNRVTAYIVEFLFKNALIRRVLLSCVVMVIVSGAVMLLFRGVAVQTSPVGWEKSFFISPYNLRAVNISMSSRGNYIASVFQGEEKGQKGIYVSVSFNGGTEFLPPVKISDIDSTIETRPHAAIAGNGHLAVVWHNLPSGDISSRIFMAISTDMGATWSQPRQLKFDTDMELLPRAFYDDRGILHLFYHAYREGAVQVFHAYSGDEKVFEDAEPITEMGKKMRGAFFPSIYFKKDNVFIVWQGKGEEGGALSDDLYFTRSTNYGRSWRSPERITRSSANDAAPSLLMHNNTLYCAYQNNEGKNWSIMLARGYERGDEWDAVPLKVSTTNVNCYTPRLVSSADNELVVFWYDNRERSNNIYARKYSIIDNKLLNEVRVSEGRASSWHPDAVSVGRRVVVHWQQSDRVMAKYTDISVMPPRVYSSTHPEDRWSRDGSAIIRWSSPRDESGIAGYATITNDLPYFNPTVQNLEPNLTRMVLPELSDGVTYFHIRAVDGAGNYSRTIHYPLKVSRSPLPLPEVESPTHAEGKAVQNDDPVLTWAVAEGRRTKGYLYSLAKDSVEDPANFTTDNRVSFKNLSPGRYFFTVRGVDKTNRPGRTASYELVVGRAEKVDTDYYRRLAQKLDQPEEQPERAERKRFPYVALQLPFDTEAAYSGQAFAVTMMPRRIPRSQVVGYSYVLSPDRKAPPRKIMVKNDNIGIDSLEEGEYVIGVRARYFTIENGEKQYHWTGPSYSAFTVATEPQESPLIDIGSRLAGRIGQHPLMVGLFSGMLTLVMLTMGVGTRISFYVSALQFRIGSLLRLVFSSTR